ncbi:MAG: CBASS oligonucleotide cyclase [Methanosarcinaceae archaeon]
MGGGGGIFGGAGGNGGSENQSSRNYKDLINEVRENTKDEAFETTVNGLITGILGEANSRDTEVIREHLDDIKQNIEENVGGTIELQYGGSVSKHTYVNGLSDVDILVKINNSELSDKSPREVLDYMKAELEGKLDNVDSIHVGKLAVTVKFSDGHEIQLLPALERSNGVKIPNYRGDNWSNIIRPEKFASRLTEVNQSCGGKVVPVVKIVKRINSQLPEDQQLSGYHVESLAIEIFKSYPEGKSKTPKVMLRYFFEKASEKVNSPIKDKTGQSIHVDDYMGEENSSQRMRASYTLGRINKKMINADEIKSVDEWEEILGEE